MALHLYVCRVGDIAPGQLRAFPVAGVTWPVIVTIVDGEILACPGVCPHEDVALAGGDLTGATITCPGRTTRSSSCAATRSRSSATRSGST